MKSNGSGARVFLALWLDSKVQCDLEKLLARAQIRAAVGCAVSKRNLHITLQFLGTVESSQQAAVMSWLPELEFEPVDLTLDSLGYWPRSGIIWLGPQKMPRELVEQVRRRRNLLKAFGFFPDRRRFRPHITLVREARAVKRFDFQPLTWFSREIVLASSETLPSAASYSVLVRSGTV